MNGARLLVTFGVGISSGTPKSGENSIRTSIPQMM
jgi:hypothetical protein